MENETKAGSPPDYKGDGLAIWKNLKKDGEMYLSVQLFGSRGIKVNCFKNEPRKQPDL